MTDYQKKLVEMLEWFDGFCEKNGIIYYAAGGTLLGAIRHKGFIPWDDDIDLIVPRKDYAKLIKVFDYENGRYRLETPFSNTKDYLFSFSKLYDTTTTLVENVRPKIKRGIYIDIFPLDGAGDTLQDAYKNFKRVDNKNMLLMTRTCSLSKKRSFIKNLSIFFMRLIPSFLINNKKLSLKVDRIASRLSFENSAYVGNLMGAYRKKEIFPKTYLGSRKKYKFENIFIYGPENYEKYLSDIYGDWKTLPPIEKRGGSHSYLYVDLNKSFMEEEK